MRNGVMLGCLLGLMTAGILAAAADKPVTEAAYIGVKKCKMCHMKQFKAWQKMKHAKNFEALVGDEKKDPECLKCHTTGFGDGGYDMNKSDEENKKFENVQCESCHGPGSKHFKSPKNEKKETIIKKSASCADCHNLHKSFGEEAKKKREAGK